MVKLLSNVQYFFLGRQLEKREFNGVCVEGRAPGS